MGTDVVKRAGLSVEKRRRSGSIRALHNDLPGPMPVEGENEFFAFFLHSAAPFDIILKKSQGMRVDGNGIQPALFSLCAQHCAHFVAAAGAVDRTRAEPSVTSGTGNGNTSFEGLYRQGAAIEMNVTPNQTERFGDAAAGVHR